MKWITALIMTSLLITSAYAGFGRGGTSGGFRSGGFSRSYSAPRSYVAPRPVYRPSYRPAPVVNNHYHGTPSVGSGGFGSSFLGGVAGAAVGNALTNHNNGTVVVAGQQPAVVASQPVMPVVEAPPVASVGYVPQQHGLAYYALIILISLFGLTVIYRLLVRA